MMPNPSFNLIAGARVIGWDAQHGALSQPEQCMPARAAWLECKA